MKFVGFDGEMEINGNALTIKKGKKDAGMSISLKNIVSVIVKKPSVMNAGGIIVQVIGDKTPPAYVSGFDLARAQNAILIQKTQYNEAVAFKELVESKIAQQSAPIQATATNSDYEKLKFLKELLDEGVITQSDFDKKKAQILGL